MLTLQDVVRLLKRIETRDLSAVSSSQPFVMSKQLLSLMFVEYESEVSHVSFSFLRPAVKTLILKRVYGNDKRISE